MNFRYTIAAHFILLLCVGSFILYRESTSVRNFKTTIKNLSNSGAKHLGFKSSDNQEELKDTNLQLGVKPPVVKATDNQTHINVSQNGEQLKLTTAEPSKGQGLRKQDTDVSEESLLESKSYPELLNFRAEIRRKYECPRATITEPSNGRVQVYQGEYKHDYKILCWLMAYDGDFPEKIKSDLETWGRRCDKVVVLSNYDDPEWFTYNVNVPETGDNRIFIRKAFACWSFLFRKWRDEFDFFVKADTDSFLIVENLRLYLDKYGRTDTPFYSGKRFQINGNQDIFVAGAAEIVNRPALDRLVCEIEKGCPEPIKDLWNERPPDGVPEMPTRKRCEIKPGNHEDVLVARCLAWWGVFAEDSRDPEGKEFFHVTTMRSTFKLPKMQNRDDYGWMSRYMKWGYLGGEAAVHKHSAVFHYYKDWKKLWTIECDLYPVDSTPAEKLMGYIHRLLL